MPTPQKRRRKGKVHRAPYRTRLEELLREDRYTFDELVAIIRAEFPGEDVSRSGIQRFDASIHEFTERMHELETSAKVIAEKYGKNAGDDTSTVLANAMVVLATDTVLKLHQKSAGGEALDVATVRAASQIAKNAQETKRVSLAVRKQIEAEAREKLLREQSERLDKVVKTGGLTEKAAADMRKKILGVR
ncbi:MAG TPA: phage protein Gp27 family protein [Solimonas sp.]